MNRWHLHTGIVVLIALALARIGTAQSQAPGRDSQSYQPAVPAAPTFNAYGAYPAYGGTTPAGSAMTGMANVISARGDYNLSTSAAAINMTQAQSNEIQNRMQYENTYFQMQETNRAYQAAQRGPRPTEEQLARIARENAPQPTSPSEVNPVSGEVNWPSVLQDNDFAADRTTIEQLSAQKAAHGSLSGSDQMEARKAIESMFAELKSQIRDVPPQSYMDARNFLRSIMYALANSDLH